MPPPPLWLQHSDLQWLFSLFREAGSELRLVGGAVRDAMMGKQELPNDIDAATPMPVDAVMELLKSQQIRTIATGIQHGTCTALLPANQPLHIEITTLRKDIACHGRHAEILATDNWQEDAQRRDFTINALYLDAEGQLYDYTQGLDDIHTHTLRFIGDASARIEEDYLRILRYFRFLAQFNMQPDAQILNACSTHKAGLHSISGERIAMEMRRLLGTPHHIASMQALYDAGIAPILALPAAPTQWLEATLPQSGDYLVELAALLREHHDTTDTLCKRWRMSRKEQQRLHLLVHSPLPTHYHTVQDIAMNHGKAAALQLLTLTRTIKTPAPYAWKTQLQAWDMPNFPVSGDDLLALGHLPGVALGHQLAELRHIWAQSGYTLEKQGLLEHIKKN